MREKRIKQAKHGLKIEKNLKVVKTAGFRAEKRRDKSVNRRAGLHDKIKNLRGERRVYKCKPLGLVHVRRIKQTVATFAAAGVAVVAYFGMGFLFKPDFIYVEELGNSTVCAAKSNAEPAGLKSAAGVEYYMPEDGSLPTDHTLIENIAYMNYVLQNQASWSSYMESTVKTVMEQKVYTHKKAYDGKVISADMPQGASNIARQFCVTDTDVSWREKGKNYIYDSMDNIEWPTDKPTGLSVADFRIYRGLPANEFSVYILNELTVKNFDEKTVEEKGVDENGKRLYSMTLDLRVHQSGLDSAVHYYKQQMYVTGGLYAWPTFDFTEVEYTFTEDWVVKEFTINDGYAAKMGSVSAPCTSSSTTVFDYNEENAVNTYYPDYFNQSYNKWDPTSSGNEPTAASCLASAFGDVLTEGATLKLELNVDGKPVNGAVYLGMDGGNFNDLRVALDGASVGGIKLYMVDESGKKTLYIAIGTNKYKLCLDAFTSSADGETEALSEEQAPAEENSGFAFDANALLEQLFGGKFELGKKGKTATLESEIELFGLKAPVKFSFNLKKGVASLNEVTANLKLGKNDVAARLTFGTEEDIPAQLTVAEKSAYTDLMDGITLGVDLGLGDIKLNGNVFIGFANGGLGEVRAKLGELKVAYAADENTLYLAHGQNVKYKLNLSEISSGNGVDLSGIVGNLDINSLLTEVLSNFYIGGGTVSTGFKVDLQQQLQQILKLAVAVDFNEGIAVDLNGEIFGKPLKLNVKIASAAVPEIGDRSEYVDLLNGGISADISASVDGLKLDGTLYIGLEGGEIAYVRVALNNDAVKIYYEREANGFGGDVIYIDLGSSKIKLPISALTGGNADGGVDFGSILSGIDFKDLLAQLFNGLGGGEFKINSSLTVNALGEEIPVSFGIDLGKQIALNLETELLGKNISANVALSNGKAPELTDRESYVDIIGNGFALSGNILLNVNGKSVTLKVNSLALKFNGGFEFEIDARVIADDKYFDLYASFVGGTVTLVYGSDEGTEGDKGNYVGVRVNTADDLDLLKAALDDAYNRLCAVLGEVAPSLADAATKENLENLIKGLGAGSASTDALVEIFKILGVEVKEGEEINAAFIFEKLGIPVDENGKVDIKGLLRAIEIKPYGNGIALGLGGNVSINLGLAEGAVEGGVSVQLGNASASVTVTDLTLGAFAPECPVSANELLSAQDLADALDYIVAACELVSEREFAVDADVDIYNGNENTLSVGVLVEYSQGENGFPVHINGGTVNGETGLRENVNFWVDSTAYLHFGLEISDKKENKNNILVDAYVLDANPAASGFKTAGSTVSDGKLDFYLSLSNGGGNPMTVYLPMEDILTVAAMGGAMLNIADIRIDGENMAEINKAVQQVASILDELLIDNYLGGLTSQFQSIGGSIVEQILRGQKIEASNLSELLNLLIKSVFGPQNGLESGGEEATAPIAPVSCGNYVKRVNFDRNGTERAVSVVLNSSAIYGGGYNDIEFNVAKSFYAYDVMPIVGEDGEEVLTQTVNKSYITGLSLKNVYYGENNANRLDLNASLGYEVAKCESFANYHNFSDISALIAAFVNSATHEVTDGNGVITAEDIAKKYALNSNYYIDGQVELGLVIFGKNIGATIKIEPFYVTINEDNTVEFNVTLSYNKVSIPLIFTLIEQAATVDLTIKDDMIYMRKTTDGGNSYVTRVMTLADFGNDMMNQLKFVLSLSDQLMDMMNGDGSGSDGGLVFNDYGDYLDKFLANYGFTDNGSTVGWNITVNKGAINSLAGMEVFSNDISVDFNAARNTDKTFSLKSLSVNSKLFSMLTLKANLNYRNPQNVWEGGNDLSDKAVKLDSRAQYGVDGRSWKSVLGGTKFTDISKNVNWGKLCRDTSGKNYIEYNGANLRYGTLKFMYATDISNTEFAEFGERYKVLYGKNVYTLLNMPDFNEVMPAVPNGDDRLVGSWDYNYVATEETDENGEVIAMYAKYGAVTVSIISSQRVEGGLNGFTDYYESEDLGYVYYKTFKYNDTDEVKLAAQNDLNTYLFKGYYDYYTGEAVEGFVADRAITLYADWQGKKINITYASDVELSGGEADGNGIYTLNGNMQYGADDALKMPVTETQGLNFLGWFMEADGSYVYVADANAVKNYFAATEIAGECVDVKLWGVWVDKAIAEITSFTRKDSFLYWSWKVDFNYTGAAFHGEKSREIGEKLGSNVSAVAVIELLDANKENITTLNNGNEVKMSGNSYSGSYTSLKTDKSGDAKWVSVKLTVTVTCGDAKLTMTDTGYKAR